MLPSETPAPGRAIRWPLFVAALLIIHFVLMIGVAVIATRDRSFAVLPNYYEKAVRWAQSQAALRKSEKLGWKLSIEPAEQIDPRGYRTVRFVLTDGSQQPIERASLKVAMFHRSHAANPVEAELQTGPDGIASALLPMRHTGFWEMDVTATAGPSVFTETSTKYVETVSGQ